MIRSIIIILYIFSQNAFSAEWKVHDQDYEQIIKIDESSINLNGNNATAEIIRDFNINKRLKTGETFRSIVMTMEVQCDSGQMRYKRWSAYSGQNLEGAIVGEKKEPTQWERSYKTDKIFSRICIGYENKSTNLAPFHELIRAINNHEAGQKPDWNLVFIEEYEKYINFLTESCKSGGGFLGEKGELWVYILNTARFSRRESCDRTRQGCLDGMPYRLSQLQNLQSRANGQCKKEVTKFLDKVLNPLLNETKIIDAWNTQYVEFETKQQYIAKEKYDSEVRIAQEQQRLAQEADERFTKFLAENKLELIYKKGGFAVTKNSSGATVYVKNGAIKKSSDVQAEINEYNQQIASDKRRQREYEEIRAKNLATKWFVTAQGVGHCFVKRIQPVGRNEDGSAVFQIAHECKRGHAGSSGVASISCGYNQSNVLRSNAVNAVCQ